MMKKIAKTIPVQSWIHVNVILFLRAYINSSGVISSFYISVLNFLLISSGWEEDTVVQTFVDQMYMK